ncbi:MAG: hypothetical protein K2H64_11665, partial [Desulfovibrio sp.]|nr:hypothetical protein [Desulfovibrio sp.]
TSLRGLPEALDGFVPERDRKTHYMRALPAGLAVHWASGNVPFLSLLVLVQSLVAKNLNIIKTAGNNFDLLRGLLSKFEGREYASASGSIKGSDLLKTLALVHYPHNNRVAAEVLSKVADVRVAWGGREAIDAICSLPSRASCVDIVFGPKLSFMVIARDALKDEASVRKALRRAATDVSSFDQAACSSPHTIFVEKGGFISPEEFARRLADAMQIALSRVPPFEESEAQKAAVETARATGAYMGQCWHSDGPGWTVIYDEESGLAKPVYSRVITVRPIGDIMEAAAFCSADIQTVGLAGEGERRVRFAEAAARNGAMRFPEIGSMTGFDNPWDGVYVMDRFVRWVSLGGAASAIAK